MALFCFNKGERMVEFKSDKERVELICKVALEMFYPDKFLNLKKRENPDFENEKVLIEVRRVILSSDAEFHSLFNRYQDKNIKDIPIHWLNKLGFNIKNYKTNDKGNEILLRSDKVGSLTFVKNDKGIYLLYYMASNLSDEDLRNEISDKIYEGLNEKLIKFNDHYDKGKENDVIFYIDEFTRYSGISFSNDILDVLISKIKNNRLLENFENIFDYIYLFFYNSISEINLKTFDCKTIKIEQKDWDKIKEKMNNL